MRTAFKLLPVVAGIFAAAFAAPSHAVGGPSGLKVGYAVQGTLGETIVNPYGLAPLTAVIRNGGYVLKHATVRIVPKEGARRSSTTLARRPCARTAEFPSSASTRAGAIRSR